MFYCPHALADGNQRIRIREKMLDFSPVLPTLYLYSYYRHTHTHPFNGPFSGTTQVNQYQKGKTNLDFTEARDSEWQWHQLGHMQVCTSLQTDSHTSTPPLSFFTGRCPSCHPTNSVKPSYYRPVEIYFSFASFIFYSHCSSCCRRYWYIAVILLRGTVASCL